jgi:hypothetical protein
MPRIERPHTALYPIQMSPNNDLPDRETFLATLTPIPITPSLSDCAICLDPYYELNSANESHLPTILSCGHILGHECLLIWFNSDKLNANTCPMDRTPLFRRRTTLRVVTTLFQNTEVLAIDGTLTRAGCRHCLLRVWEIVCSFVSREQDGRVDADVSFVGRVTVWRLVSGAIPDCVVIQEEAWALLEDVVRELLVRCRQGVETEASDWINGWEWAFDVMRGVQRRD